MCVLSKLLYGRLHVRSFDVQPVGDLAGLPPDALQAHLRADEVCDVGSLTARLTATEGNLHEFVALGPPAVWLASAPPFARGAS